MLFRSPVPPPTFLVRDGPRPRSRLLAFARLFPLPFSRPSLRIASDLSSFTRRRRCLAVLAGHSNPARVLRLRASSGSDRSGDSSTCGLRLVCDSISESVLCVRFCLQLRILCSSYSYSHPRALVAGSSSLVFGIGALNCGAGGRGKVSFPYVLAQIGCLVPVTCVRP